MKQTIDEIRDIMKTAVPEEQDRIIILPVPIGAPVYTLYRDHEVDGTGGKQRTITLIERR